MSFLSKIPVPVYPLLAVMGGALGGLGYVINHQLRHPDIVWARRYVFSYLSRVLSRKPISYMSMYMTYKDK